MSMDVASGPAAWGVYETASETEAGDVLDAILAAGYAGTTLGSWGYFPTDVETLRAELSARDLRLAGACVGVNFGDPDIYEADSARALEIGLLLAALDVEVMALTEIVAPDSRPAQEAGRVRGPRFSADDWEDFAAQVSRIAQTLRQETGLRLAYRPYAGTHVEIAEEAALLMERLDPALVGLCLDTGHWRYAGGDSLSALRHYGGRIWQLYLSDCDPNIRQFAIDEKLTYFEATQAGIFCPLGSGDVDLPGIVKALRRMDYPGWLIVEQDALSYEPEVQLAFARANREYLHGLGL